MIEYKVGDIFEEDVEALVNSVNCVGVMGRGIALQFKKVYPANYKAYRAACERNEVQPGRMFVFKTGQVSHPHYIINFPTKRDWRNKSRIEDIELGLEDLARVIRERNINSIAVPPLGSDLGKLDWYDVRPLIEDTLRQFEGLKAVIFEPRSAGAYKPVRSSGIPKMTVARAALISLMTRYLRASLDPYVTLLEIHKLMYFMQASGEPLKLKYEKGPYGPYAQNLRHILQTLDGHMIFGYGDGGEMPHKPLRLASGMSGDAERFLTEHPETRRRLERVTELIEGFEMPFGVELLATVHWVAEENHNATEDEIICHTHAWSDRKRQFSENHIKLAIKTLRNHGFVPPTEGMAIPFAFHFADSNRFLQASRRFEGM